MQGGNRDETCDADYQRTYPDDLYDYSTGKLNAGNAKVLKIKDGRKGNDSIVDWGCSGSGHEEGGEWLFVSGA